MLIPSGSAVIAKIEQGTARSTSDRQFVFRTSVRSTCFPFATLYPRVEKVFQFSGRFGKTSSSVFVDKTTKRGPDFSMNGFTVSRSSNVIQPFTRERKYQTRLGSLKSTAP